jgi:hypothetical protein
VDHVTTLANFFTWMAVYGWYLAAPPLAAITIRGHLTRPAVADRRSYRRLLREDRARRAAHTPYRAARPQLPVDADACPASASTGTHPHGGPR